MSGQQRARGAGAALLPCFLLSGAGGLVFQVVWSRLLTGVFGATSFAIGTVLAAFMGGLALGAMIAGRFAPRVRHPMRWYAALELAVAAYGLVFPWLLELLAPVNRLLWQLGLPFGAMSAVRLVLVFALLAPPTAAMGATLPLLARWTAARRGRAGGRVGALYAANTAGALIGSLLAGFVLLPTLGVALTNGVAAGLDAMAAALALAMGWNAGESAPPIEDPEADEREELLADMLPALEPTPDAGVRRVVAWSYAAAGFCGMAYEVLWSRALSIVVGSSVYSFTLVLAVYLGGHALGAALAARWVGRARRPVAALAAVHGATALLAAGAFFAVDRLPHLFLQMIRAMDPTFGLLVLSQVAVIALIVLPAATVGGAVFPLVIRLLAEGGDVGEEVGRAYGFNTVGSISGSVLGGFVILPVLGLGDGMKLVCLVQLAAGLALAWKVTRQSRALWLIAAAAAVAVVAGPDLRPGRLAAGMFRVALAKDTYAQEDYEPGEVAYYRDGLNATITVEARGDHRAIKANGKPEASSDEDMPSQILVGLTPLLLHDKPEDVVLIGFGSGVTAGAILQDRRVDRLTVVELERGMIEASAWFEDINHKPLDDRRLELVYSDGRNLLAVTDQRYDVIVSEPSNPWIAGVGSLFTVEHFRAARRRLKPGGLYMQWLQLYEMRPENVRSVVATFQSAFPHVWVFSTKPAGVDLMLIGSQSPIRPDAAKLAEGWRDPQVAAEMLRGGVKTPWDLLSLTAMTPPDVPRFAGNAELNTDDNARLEFSAPLDLARMDDDPWYIELYFRDAYANRLVDAVAGVPEEGEARALALGEFTRGLVRQGRFLQARDLLANSEADGRAADEARIVLNWFEGGPGDVPRSLGQGSSEGYRQMIRKVGGGWFQEALDAFAQMPEHEQLDDRNRVLLGYLLLLAGGRDDEALDVLEELAGQDDGALVRRYPLILYLLGRAEYEMSRFRSAFDHLLAYDRLENPCGGVPCVDDPQGRR